MRKILIIASREFNAAVRSKAFIISLVTMPIFMFGSLIFQSVIKNQADTSDQHFAVVDRSPDGLVGALLKAAAIKRNESQITDPATGKKTLPSYLIEIVPASTAGGEEGMLNQRLELSDKVRQGKLLGYLEVGPDVYRTTGDVLPLLNARGKPVATAEDRTAVRFQTNTPMDTDFSDWARTIVTAAVMQRRANSSGVSMQAITDALRPVPVVIKQLTKKDPLTGQVVDAKEENRLVSFLLPVALSLLMFMMILLGTTPLLNSVMEEKMARIAEVLLGSVTPFELMLGKLIGMVGVSLTSVMIYLGGVYWAAYRFGFSEYLTLGMLAWFILFQSLGVLMFGSLFIAIGAASTDSKEAQSLITPVMFLATIPFFVLAQVIEHPNGKLATGMSFFPFATPSLMVMRLAIPPGIPWWQPWAGMGVVLLTTIACVWAAGRIFRVGLLMQGKGANLGEMMKWVFKG